MIEIVSPSSRRMDYRLKLPVYREAGVREYWIVDYHKKMISVHFLQNPDAPLTYGFYDIIKPGIYEDFEIDFSQLLEYLR